MHKKCPYSEFFWSLFSRIRTEYENLQSISLYSVRMQENADQKSSEYRHFLHIVGIKDIWKWLLRFVEKIKNLQNDLWYFINIDS